MYYFGQSTWDSEVDRIFKQEYSDENHQLADMLASLESNLEKYEEYMKDQRAHMDAADNRGEHVVFYSKEILSILKAAARHG